MIPAAIDTYSSSCARRTAQREERVKIVAMR
jgi:hypothetical protein